MNKEIILDIRKTATVKIGLNNKIEYANPYILDILGYQIMEFITQPPKTICHPDMPDVIHDTIGSFIMNYKEGVAVLKHITKNGDYFWAFTQYKPSYKPDGSFEAFVTIRKPLPSKKITGEKECLKLRIADLYKSLLDIEKEKGIDQAMEFLKNYLEKENFNSLEEYYLSFFDFKKNQLDEYFAINENTPEKTIKKYMNI
jgi:PAS domain S-box-containing protein